MWMGGVPALGYRAQDRKLVVVDSEAEILRFIFRCYAELGFVRLLKDELQARSIQSKSRTSASGRISGGRPFMRGALYLMLQNRIYRGEIVHKGTILSWRTPADHRSAAGMRLRRSDRHR
jgi:site-specific DNA recombinase